MAAGAARSVAEIVVLAGALVAAGCGGNQGAPGGEAARSAGPIAGCLDVDGPAVAPNPADTAATRADQGRYEQLRVETLRLMIDAARLALPIGPCQNRIDRAARAASQGDVPAAADIMEDVAAGLRRAIADARP